MCFFPLQRYSRAVTYSCSPPFAVFLFETWLTQLHLTDLAFSCHFGCSVAASACRHNNQCNLESCHWLRQSPPPQEHENTEEREPRDILPETSPSRRPKLLQQPQIHLHRLPHFLLQSCRIWPLQLRQCVEQCIAKSHPFLSQLMTVHDFSKNEQSATPPPKPSEAKITPSRPLPPDVKERFPLKFPVLRLRSLPPSVAKSAGHDQIRSLSTLPKLSPKARFQPPAGTEDKKSTNKSVRECHQAVAPVEQEDNRRIRPEEEKKDSIKRTVLKDCPTDPHCLLRPQNPAECLAVNTLSGLTCGVPQKGLSQNKHKIRVDFKVCFSVCIS